MKKGRMKKEEIQYIKDNVDIDITDPEIETIAKHLDRSIDSVKKQIGKIAFAISEETSEATPTIITADNGNAQLEILNMIKSGQVTPEQGIALLASIAPAVQATKEQDDLKTLPSFSKVWGKEEYADYVDKVKENEFFKTDERGEIILDEGGYKIPTDKLSKFRKNRGPIRTMDKKGNCLHKSVTYDGKRQAVICNACGTDTSKGYSPGKNRSNFNTAKPNRNRK